MSKRGRVITERICPGCGVNYGTESPLPWTADVHPLVNGTLITTCSVACRLKLGLPERKVVGR